MAVLHNDAVDFASDQGIATTTELTKRLIERKDKDTVNILQLEAARNSDGANAPPPWVAMIDAYCRFQSERLAELRVQIAATIRRQRVLQSGIDARSVLEPVIP